jgi:hypothetical protein
MEGQAGFDFEERDEGRSGQQEEHLERVSSRIERSIIRFCEANPTFHADDLRKFVVRETGITAPASADRILRNLRQRGVVNYVVVNRRESLYRVISINGKPANAKED